MAVRFRSGCLITATPLSVHRISVAKVTIFYNLFHLHLPTLNKYLIYNLNIIVGAIPTVLDIKVQEGDINDVILINLYQPFAILTRRIVFRVILGKYDSCIGGKSATTGDGNAFVTGVKSTGRIRDVGMELDEHLIPEAGVHYRFRRVTDFD